MKGEVPDNLFEFPQYGLVYTKVAKKPQIEEEIKKLEGSAIGKPVSTNKGYSEMDENELRLEMSVLAALNDQATEINKLDNRDEKRLALEAAKVVNYNQANLLLERAEDLIPEQVELAHKVRLLKSNLAAAADRDSSECSSEHWCYWWVRRSSCTSS